MGNQNCMIVFNRKTSLLILAILLLGCGVRFYGLGFGLPHTQCRPDEDTIIHIALGFFSGDLNPHYFFYPTLYMYLLYTIYYGYFFVRLQFGSSFAELLTEIAFHPNILYLISRGVAALFGALTVVMVYLIAKQTCDKRTAGIASFFMSIAYLHVRDSHFGTTDTVMTFLITCAMYYILQCYHRRSIRHYLLAGIFTGLATSTKYGSMMLIIPMLLAHFGTYTAATESTLSSRMIKAITKPHFWVYGVTAILSFFLCSPFILLDFKTFLQHFFFQVDHIILQEQREHFLLRGWWYHLRYTLPYGMGWGMFLTSLIGIGIHGKKETKMAIILYAFPLVYYLVGGRGFVTFVRYMIPVVPFLCIASATCILKITRILRQVCPRKYLLTVLIIIVAVQPGYNVLRVDQLLSRKDNRVIAAEWICQNLPSGNTIYQTGSVYGQVQLPLSRETLQQKYEEAFKSGSNAGLLRIQIESLKNTDQYIGYHLWMQNIEEIESKAVTPPEYIILQESPLGMYGKISDAVRKLIDTQYTLIQAFEVFEEQSSFYWYDQMDAFYLPFVGFRSVIRPGPDLYIYKHHTVESN